MKQLIIIAVSLMMLEQAYSQNLHTQKEQEMETEYLTFKLSDKATKQNVQYKTGTELP